MLLKLCLLFLMANLISGRPEHGVYSSYGFYDKDAETYDFIRGFTKCRNATIADGLDLTKIRSGDWVIHKMMTFVTGDDKSIFEDYYGVPACTVFTTSLKKGLGLLNVKYRCNSPSAYHSKNCRNDFNFKLTGGDLDYSQDDCSKRDQSSYNFKDFEPPTKIIDTDYENYIVIFGCKKVKNNEAVIGFDFGLMVLVKPDADPSISAAIHQSIQRVHNEDEQPVGVKYALNGFTMDNPVCKCDFCVFKECNPFSKSNFY